MDSSGRIRGLRSVCGERTVRTGLWLGQFLRYRLICDCCDGDSSVGREQILQGVDDGGEGESVGSIDRATLLEQSPHALGAGLRTGNNDGGAEEVMERVLVRHRLEQSLAE